MLGRKFFRLRPEWLSGFQRATRHFVGVLQIANGKTKASIGGFGFGLLDGTLTPSLNRGSG